MNKAALASLALLAAACWPYIPADWRSEYRKGQEDPQDSGPASEVQLLGAGYDNVYLGDYWTGGSYEFREMQWGWLAWPRSDVNALHFWQSQTLGCQQVITNRAFDVEFADPGASLSYIDGPSGETALAWVSTRGYFYGYPEYLLNGSYALRELETENAGTLGAEDFLVPNAVVFSGPDLDRSTPYNVTASELQYSWEVELNTAQYVSLHVTMYSSDSVELEAINCVVEYEDGYVSIPEELWTRLDDAKEAFVFRSVLQETRAEVGSDGTTSSMLGMRQEIGVVDIVQ